MTLTHSQLMSLIVELMPMMDVWGTPTDAGAVKNHSGRYITHRVIDGWFDWTGCLGQSYLQPGRGCLIEVKVDRDKPKPKQVEWADRLIKAGALVIREARSIEEVKNVLEKERKHGS